MTLKKELKFLDYNKDFPKLFKKEKSFLQKIGAKEIYHVGSSAMPKMPGKGAIDILILAKSQKEKLNLKKKLVNKGYTQGKSKENFRYFFWKIQNNQEYCIHLMLSSNPHSRDQIIFRDFINKSPQEFKQYLRLKKQNFKQANGDRSKYRELKEKYFQEISRRLKED